MRSLILLCLSALPAFSQEPGPFASFDRASEAVLADPHDLAIGPDGRLYVADKFGARIAVLDAETLELIEMLGEGFLPGSEALNFLQDAKGIWAHMMWPRRRTDRSGSLTTMPAALYAIPRT